MHFANERFSIHKHGIKFINFMEVKLERLIKCVELISSVELFISCLTHLL